MIVVILCFFTLCELSSATKLTVEYKTRLLQENCSSITWLEEHFTDLAKKWNNATHNVIDEIEVVLPSGVDHSHSCWLKKTLKKSFVKSPRTDFHIVSKDLLLNTTSQQYGQCRQSGRGVLLPQFSSHSESTLNNWINDKYGVFLESTQRQKLLCQGQLAFNVVQELTQPHIPRAYSSPSFTYISKPKKKAYVLAVQRSFPEVKTASQSLTWETVQGALLPFISGLPSGNQLAIVTFDQKNAELSLPLTTMTDDNRVILHAALPRRPVINEPLSMEACHKCGVDLIQSLIVDEDVDLQIIWMTVSGRLEPGYQLPINSVVLGLNRNIDRSWINLPSKSLFVLGQCASERECQEKLVNELMRSLGHVRPLWHASNVQGEARGTTKIGHTVRRITFLVTATDERDIAWLRLTSPTGKPYVFPIYSHKMALLQIREEDVEVGQWIYDVKMYDDQNHFDFDVYVEEEGVGALEAWVEAKLNHLGHPRISFFARSLETPTKVEAVVSRPGHLSKDLPHVEMSLKDSGSGYPDIRSGDGIYSAYFTDLSPEEGFYEVLVRASYEDGTQRTTLAPSFYVPQLSSSFYLRKEEGSNLLVSDVFPPNRITDVGIIAGAPEESQLYVTLNWTAPGGDFDVEGTSAFRYEIRCATSEDSLLENNYGDQSIPVHLSLIPQPLPAGSKQRCTVGVPWHNQTFYYAVVAIDAAGNRGLISNVVSVLIVGPPEEENEIVASTEPAKEPKIAAQPRYADSQDVVIWAPIVAVVALTFLASVIFIIYRRTKFVLHEYVCDEKDTNTTGVSTDSDDLSSKEDLSSIVSSECKLDIWSSSVNLEPRIHIMEDFSVYRDLSTISSEIPSEYLKIDAMLSTLLAAQRQMEEVAPVPPPRHESLV